MKVVWTARAERHVADICHYIALDNPSAAIHMDGLFHDAAARLAVFPQMGKTGHLPGTRELFPHKHYRLIYQVDEPAQTIWILALVHGAQQWPPPPE